MRELIDVQIDTNLHKIQLFLNNEDPDINKYSYYLIKNFLIEKISEAADASIFKNEIIPKEQTGDVVIFKRRKPSERNLNTCIEVDLESWHNHIRMLDAETYPKANIKYGNFEISFFNVKQGKDEIYAQVIIKNIEN